MTSLPQFRIVKRSLQALFLIDMPVQKIHQQKPRSRSKRRDPLAYFSQELSQDERLRILAEVGHAANIEQSRVLYGKNQG